MNLPLPTGEVDFVSERSEFTKSGEGSIVKVINGTKSNCHAELVSASVRGETLKQVQGDNAFVYGDNPCVIASVAKQSQHGLTLNRLLRRFTPRNDERVGKRSFAFTLSEVLIVLAVLGVIAAMTIPDLIQDYQKKATATQVKKVYSNLNQVVTASAADNGPMLDFLAVYSTVDANATKEFFETYWFPYIKVQKVADNNTNFYGSYHPYFHLNGTQYGNGIITSYSQGRVLFSDISGRIYWVCTMDWDGGVAKYSSSQEVVVDLNGKRGPNTLGKDVFVFLVSSNGVVNPANYGGCSSSSTGIQCAAKIKRDGWKIADDYPW